MLMSLQVKNFRALEHFNVSKLGRVNLIVGKNNSGKSSVLEALRIYAGNGNLNLLEAIAAGHDEKYRFHESDREDQDVSFPFEDFFSGRHFPAEDDKAIEIGDPSSNHILHIQHGYFVETRVPVMDEDADDTMHRVRIGRRRIAKSELASVEGEEVGQALYVQKGERQTSHRLDSGFVRGRMAAYELPGNIPCSVIPTQFVSIDELADEWDKIALTDEQEIVKSALKIISDDFEAITFVRNDDSYRIRRELKRSAKVRLRDNKRPVPLNSLGDGMLRVLQLVLKIFPAKGGFLLIDEFENGLHYSVQEKVWSLVFELALKLDIQVFATTHSWDCIESFSKVAAARKDIEGVLFRVGRSARTSDQGRIIATVFDEEQLFNITQSDVEVR